MSASDPLLATWSPRLLERIHFVALGELEAGPKFGMCQVYTGYWWIVHPKFGAIFYRRPPERGWGSAQCNQREAFAKQFRDDDYPGALVVHLPRALVPIDLSDYR